jgi:hypothetical protein
MAYRVVEEKKFAAQIAQLEKVFPRIKDFKKELYNILQRNPFLWGRPIPKEPHWKYGVYFEGKSDQVGKFPPFRVLYRVDDDCVHLISIGIIL